MANAAAVKQSRPPPSMRSAEPDIYARRASRVKFATPGGIGLAASRRRPPVDMTVSGPENGRNSGWQRTCKSDTIRQPCGVVRDTARPGSAHELRAGRDQETGGRDAYGAIAGPIYPTEADGAPKSIGRLDAGRPAPCPRGDFILRRCGGFDAPSSRPVGPRIPIAVRPVSAAPTRDRTSQPAADEGPSARSEIPCRLRRVV